MLPFFPYFPSLSFLLSPSIMHLIQYAVEADAPGLARVNVESFLGRNLFAEVFPTSSVPRMRNIKQKSA